MGRNFWPIPYFSSHVREKTRYQSPRSRKKGPSKNLVSKRRKNHPIGNPPEDKSEHERYARRCQSQRLASLTKGKKAAFYSVGIFQRKRGWKKQVETRASSRSSADARRQEHDRRRIARDFLPGGHSLAGYRLAVAALRRKRVYARVRASIEPAGITRGPIYLREDKMQIGSASARGPASICHGDATHRYRLARPWNYREQRSDSSAYACNLPGPRPPFLPLLPSYVSCVTSSRSAFFDYRVF